MNNYQLCDENDNPVDLDNTVYPPPRPKLTKEEWLTELEKNWITNKQMSRIMRTFSRLGFDIGSDYLAHAPGLDRAERLSVTSWLIGRELETFNDMKQGEAGRLIKLLSDVHTVDDLYDLLPDEYWEDEPEDKPKRWIGMVIVAAGIALMCLD